VDEAKRRHDGDQALANLLTVASGAAVVAVAGFCVLTLSLRPEPMYVYGAAGAYGASAAAVAWLARTQRLRAALRLFVAQNWVVAVGFLFLEGAESGHTGIFFVTIILAGLLLRPWTAVVAAGGSALAVVLVTWLAANGAYEAPMEPGPPWMYLVPSSWWPAC